VHAAGLDRHDAHHGADGGRLAHPVAAEQRHQPAGRDLEADAEQNLAQTVGGLDALEPQRHAGISSPR
jgi:hypothetical protein